MTERDGGRTGWTAAGIAGLLLLAGCGRPESGTRLQTHGRYAGVGLYPAGRMWAQVVAAGAKDSATARLADDEQVIVTVDSLTGEVRQCGALSGWCIGLNPWARPLGSVQVAPVHLAKHAEDLDHQGAATAPASTVGPPH